MGALLRQAYLVLEQGYTKEDIYEIWKPICKNHINLYYSAEDAFGKVASIQDSYIYEGYTLENTTTEKSETGGGIYKCTLTNQYDYKAIITVYCLEIQGMPSGHQLII